MIDRERETPITLSKAAAGLPGSDKSGAICSLTIWRWATKGLRGVKLETLCIGNQRYTTREAVQRFIDSLTAVRNELVSPDAVERRRRRGRPNIAHQKAVAAHLATEHGITFEPIGKDQR